MSRSLQTPLIAPEGVPAPEFSSIEAWLGRPGNTRDYYREQVLDVARTPMTLTEPYPDRVG